MQRIMQAQALGDAARQAHMQGKRTLEINPRHPLVVELLGKVEADAEDEGAAFTARLLWETALLESGYPMEDHHAFAGRVRSRGGRRRTRVITPLTPTPRQQTARAPAPVARASHRSARNGQTFASSRPDPSNSSPSPPPGV